MRNFINKYTISIVIFLCIAIESYFLKNYNPVISAAFVLTMIWFPDFWNMIFPVGSIQGMRISQETPVSLLSFLGWVVLLIILIYATYSL